MSQTVSITSFKKKGRYFYAGTDKSGEIKLHPEICLEFSLHDNISLPWEIWQNIIYQNDFRLAWESTLRLLAVRSHCERDLANKLRQRKFNGKIINAVVQECKRLDFIDDKKFAKEYINELLARGSGVKMIKAKLMAKGIQTSMIDEVMSGFCSAENELDAAKTACRKKAPSLKKETDPRKKKEKMFRYLFSKGFSYDIIQQVWEEELGNQ